MAATGFGSRDEDVALLEAAFSGEVQVAAAVRADGAGFLALDVALEPGGVDRLNQEFLVGIDGQTQESSVLWEDTELGPHRVPSIYHRSSCCRSGSDGDACRGTDRVDIRIALWSAGR